MLYVSGYDKYNVSVTDTHDSVTETVSRRKLLKYLWDGVEVKGAEVCGGNLVLRVIDINFEIRLTKLLMLTGLQLTVKGDTLFEFELVRPLNTNVIIRLSDYCKHIRNYAFIGGKYELKPAWSYLTIIVDDKVDFPAGAFMNLARYNVNVDVHEMTDERLVKDIYSNLSYISFISRSYLIDDTERYLRHFVDWLTENPDSDIDIDERIYNKEECEYAHDYYLSQYKSYINKLNRRPVNVGVKCIEFNTGYYYNDLRSVIDVDKPSMHSLCIFLDKYFHKLCKHFLGLSGFIKYFATDSDTVLVNKYNAYADELIKLLKINQ